MTWPQFKRRECDVDGRRVSLSEKETRALALLLLRYPAPVSSQDLAEVMYPNPDTQPLTATMVAVSHIRFLRGKLGRSSIQTRPGFGYVLNQRDGDESLADFLEPVFALGGMPAVISACQRAQQAIAERHVA